MKLSAATTGARKLTDSVNGDHKNYEVLCPTCQVHLGATHVSHGKSSQDIGDALVSLMARQLNISRVLWLDIAGCTKGLPEYLAERGHSHAERGDASAQRAD